MNAAAETTDASAVTATTLRADARHMRHCPICGNAKPRGLPRCTNCRGVRLFGKQSISPDAIVSSITRYHDDVAAQLFVAYFNHGAALEYVAEALGMSKQAAQLLEQRAMANFTRRARLAGLGR